MFRVIYSMPEGPTLRILSEKLQPFVGKRIEEAVGYAKGFDAAMLNKQTITSVKSFGKQLLISFHDFSIRIHMGLFGSYRINDRGKKNASLGMYFDDGEVNFYIARVNLITEPLEKVYDWSADVMSPKFSKAKARKKLLEKPQRLVCDVLLDQDIFAGSGNIVKNEVMFRTKLHPLNTIGDLPPRKLGQLITETLNFCQDFYNWRKEGVLRMHLEAHEQKMCPRNKVPFLRADLGKTKRHTYYCPLCQLKYGEVEE